MTDIVVASHHKSGSTYAKKSFSEFARLFGYEFLEFGHEETPNEYELSRFGKKIFYFSHARLSDIRRIQSVPRELPLRTIHFIRDPRALIVSATKYHLDSDENWLSIPNKRFKGKSYQEALRSEEGYAAQLIFEMRNGSSESIRHMTCIYKARACEHVVRLEDISWDRSGKIHGALAEYLLGSSNQISACLEVLIRNSLFSMNQLPRHSRTRVSRSVLTDFHGEVLEFYNKYFPSAHTDLGYCE